VSARKPRPLDPPELLPAIVVGSIVLVACLSMPLVAGRRQSPVPA